MIEKNSDLKPFQSSRFLPDDIMARIPQASEYLESRDDVVFAYLFGGLSKGKPNPLSDVDIAIYIDSRVDPVKTKKDVIQKLVDILKTDNIDLIVLNQSSLTLSMNVLKSNQILADKKPFVRHSYQSLIMRKYFDYSQLESGILKRRFYNG